MSVTTLNEFRTRQLAKALSDSLAQFEGRSSGPETFEAMLTAAVDAMTELELRTVSSWERLTRAEYRAIVVRALRKEVPWMVPESEP